MNYTNHSGGAHGADTKWDEIGKTYEFNNHKHYWYGQKTPIGNIELTKEELEEVITCVPKLFLFSVSITIAFTPTCLQFSTN